MSANSMIQSNAWEKLRGQWGSAAIATLIFCLINGAASAAYLSILIVGPMSVGYILYLMKLVDHKVSDFNTLFQGFNNFANTLVAGILVSLIEVVGFCLLIVPGIIAALGLSMTFFIMAEDSTISGTDAMKQSWEMMKGHKWELFCLCCRFIGWLLLCIITCGILTLWINPYIEVSFLNFYRNLKYGQY